MVKRADCLMETQRRSRKRLLGEEVVHDSNLLLSTAFSNPLWKHIHSALCIGLCYQEVGGGEKRARVGEVVVVSRSDDTRCHLCHTFSL